MHLCEDVGYKDKVPHLGNRSGDDALPLWPRKTLHRVGLASPSLSVAEKADLQVAEAQLFKRAARGTTPVSNTIMDEMDYHRIQLASKNWFEYIILKYSLPHDSGHDPQFERRCQP